MGLLISTLTMGDRLFMFFAAIFWSAMSLFTGHSGSGLFSKTEASLEYIYFYNKTLVFNDFL